MAYIKGPTYIWSDSEHLHIWSETGRDHWQTLEAYRHLPDAAGVQIDEGIADEFAVMRFAELARHGSLSAVIDRALAHGNFGGEALSELAPVLKALGPAV